MHRKKERISKGFPRRKDERKLIAGREKSNIADQEDVHGCSGGGRNCFYPIKGNGLLGMY